LGVGACGSSNSASTTNASAAQGGSAQRNGPGAALRDPKVQACLKKQGVAPPAGGGADGGRFAQRFEQLRAALAKCGVQLPQGGFRGRPPQQQGQDTATTQT
jgi:hypothetical protein